MQNNFEPNVEKNQQVEVVGSSNANNSNVVNNNSINTEKELKNLYMQTFKLPSGGSIDLIPMDDGCIKILTNKLNNTDALFRAISRCVVKMNETIYVALNDKQFYTKNDIIQLYTGDLTYILMALRIITFVEDDDTPSKLELEDFVCPHCKAKNNFEIDIVDILKNDCTPLSGDLNPVIDFMKYKIRLNYMNGAIEQQLSKSYNPNSADPRPYVFARIDAVDINDGRGFTNLTTSWYDMNIGIRYANTTKLQKIMREFEFGPKTVRDLTCESCERTISINIMGEKDFFYPS